MFADELGAQRAAEGVADQDEPLRHLQQIQRRFYIAGQFRHVIPGTIFRGRRIRVAVPAQIERDYTIVRLKLLKLVFPIGCTAAEAMNKNDRQCSMLIAVIGAGIDHAHCERLSLRKTAGQPDGLAMKVRVESDYRIVAG